MSYYEKELSHIGIDCVVQFKDANGNSTKWMDLNVESIEAIDEFIEKLKLKKEILNKIKPLQISTP
jgi:hypothetical protein